MPKTKRIFVGADPHCGHVAGLTPPAYQLRVTRKADLATSKRNKFAEIEAECWKSYVRGVQRHKPFDAAIWLGDLIDGPGTRSGGTELIVVDREEQAEMFVCCARVVDAPVQRLVYGTGYHAGEAEDWEAVIASQMREFYDTRIGSHEWFNINGLVFDVKHFVSGSSVPHGRNTSVERDWLWNTVWARRDWQPQADVLIRAHVHYFRFGGDRDGLRIVAPALQAMGTKYGSRKCSGLVDWGFLVFEVTSRKDWDWHPYLPDIQTQQAKAETL